MANPQPEPSMDEILASIRRIISEEDTVPAPQPEAGPLELDDEHSVSVSDRSHDALQTPADDLMDELAASPLAEEPVADPAPELPPAPPVAEAPAADPVVFHEESRPEPVQPAEPPAPSQAEETHSVSPMSPAHQDQNVSLNDVSYAAPETLAVNAAADTDRNIDFSSITERANRASHAVKSTPLVSDVSASVASEAFGVLQENIRISQTNERTMEDIVEAMLRPMIQGWLDTNLPRIVEEKVEEEVRRIARRR